MTLEEILGQQDVLGQAMNMEADTSGMTQQQIDEGISKSRHDLFSQLGAMPVGAVEGIVGLPGDVERLGRGAFGAATADSGNRWNTFLNELGNSDTTLPNTESIQNWTDKQLDGTAFGDMLKAGGDGRLIGEILAPLPPLAGAVKYGGKGLDFLDDGVTAANKVLNRFDIQPGLSIKDVSKANRPGYIYKTVNTVNGKKYIGSKLSPQGHKGKYFNENYYGSGSDLKKAIAEHGKDKFINVKEMDTRTVPGLKKAEQGLLNRVGARQDPAYYNNHNHYSGGGDPTEVTRKKISAALKGKPKPYAKGRETWNKGKVTGVGGNKTKGRTAWNKGTKTGPITPEQLAARKGREPWNKGKKTGKPAWNSGKKMSKESREKMSNSRRGIKLTKEHRDKIKSSMNKHFKGLL